MLTTDIDAHSTGNLTQTQHSTASLHRTSSIFFCHAQPVKTIHSYKKDLNNYSFKKDLNMAAHGMVHLLITRSHLHKAVMHVVVVGALGLVDRQLLVVHLRTGDAMLFSDPDNLQVNPRIMTVRLYAYPMFAHPQY